MNAPIVNTMPDFFSIDYKESLGAIGAAFSAVFGGWKVWKVASRKLHLRREKIVAKEHAINKLIESAEWLRSTQEQIEQGAGRMDRLIASVDEIRDKQTQIELLTSLIHGSQGIFLVMAGIAAWRSSPDGKCVFATDALADLMGCDVEEIKGFGWVTAIHEDDREPVKRDYLDACSHKRKFQYFYRYRHPDQTIRYVRGVAYPIVSVHTGLVYEFWGQAVEVSKEEWAERK